jgi:hypothetical protein
LDHATAPQVEPARAPEPAALESPPPESGPALIVVRLSEPTLINDLQSFLAGTTGVSVFDRQNQLEIELPPDADVAADLRRVRRIASAWQMNGHLDVRAEVALVRRRAG